MIGRRIARFSPAVALAVAIAACSPSPSTATPTPGPGGTAGAGTSASIEPLASFGPPPSPSPDAASPVVVDGALVGLLPESVGGFPLKEDIDEATKALSDPTLARIASAVDAAVAVDLSAGDFVLAWIVRLRPDTFSDNAYRQWRDSYDEGACAAAGGVVGRAQAQIGGRQTFVTSCVAGLHTYHVWLKDQDILISVSALGEGRFGEKLLEGLRVPA